MHANEKAAHNGAHAGKGEMGKGAGPLGAVSAVLNGLPSILRGNLFAVLFFVAVWALLVFCEPALLFRVNELSVFLYDNLFYEELMSLPAGILYYVASWFVQFFYIPLLGATIYVGLLAFVYWLTYRVFDISPRRRLLAMLPVCLFQVSTNTVSSKTLQALLMRYTRRRAFLWYIRTHRPLLSSRHRASGEQTSSAEIRSLSVFLSATAALT